MKKFFIFLSFFGASLCAYPQHSPQLKPHIQRLYQLKETQQLIQEVERAGPITIKTAYFGEHASTAMWFPDQRTICINVSHQRTLGKEVRSIVVELYNALCQKQFDQLDWLASQGRISKEKYIESVEQIEYSNCSKVSQLLSIGIKKGIFPKDCELPIFSTFAEHYQIQRQVGHSALIGGVYEQLVRR